MLTTKKSIDYEKVKKFLEEKGLAPEDAGLCPNCFERGKIVNLRCDPKTHEYYCPVCGFVMEGEPKTDAIPFPKDSDEPASLRGKVFFLPDYNIGSHLDEDDLMKIIVPLREGREHLTRHKAGVLLSSSVNRVKRSAYDIIVNIRSQFITRDFVRLTYDDLNEVFRLFDKVYREMRKQNKSYDSKLLIVAILFIYLRRKYLHLAVDEIIDQLYESYVSVVNTDVSEHRFKRYVMDLSREIIPIIGGVEVSLGEIVEAIARRYDVDPAPVKCIVKECMKKGLKFVSIDVLSMATVRLILEMNGVNIHEKFKNDYISTKRIERLVERIKSVIPEKTLSQCLALSKQAPGSQS